MLKENVLRLGTREEQALGSVQGSAYFMHEKPKGRT